MCNYKLGNFTYTRIPFLHRRSRDRKLKIKMEKLRLKALKKIRK